MSPMMGFIDLSDCVDSEYKTQMETEKQDDDMPYVTTDVKDKVYVVWYDNGDTWEDNFQDVDRIFKSYEDAEKYLDDCGYSKQVENGINGEYMVWYPHCETPYLYEVSTYTIREFDLY